MQDAGSPDLGSHPRSIGWLGTVALAMGGSNQSLFLIGTLVAAQGTAALPLLVVGLLLAFAALPGWTELILMWPRRVGGIAATCAEAFRPYSPVLANLTGVAYWWGWVPTCGLTAILSASALHEWYLPWVPIHALAAAIVLLFCAINLIGVRWATRVALPLAFASGGLALVSCVGPVLAGHVDWHRAASFHLSVPFPGGFGALTSAMAGLYLIGFAAPAFEAAACHVGETVDPQRNVVKAMYRAALVAVVYFVVLPPIWLGALGPHALEGQLMATLGPTFAPLLGGLGKAAAIWFMVFNMFHGTLQPLAGAARTLSQLSEDGLLPAGLSRRNRFDAPWLATVLTAGMAIVFLQTGDPPWVIAAANFCYLLGIALPSVAVWLLRRNARDAPRLYRAPRFTVGLGLGAAIVWLATTLLGLEQFGLPTVLASLGMAYSGSVLYGWRRWREHRAEGRPQAEFWRSLHAKLTGAMIAVMALDGAGYLLAVSHVNGDPELVAMLQDIFVGVAVLTVAVGLVLPGMIAHAVGEVSSATRRLAAGTISELTEAMRALGRGDLEAARAHSGYEPVTVRSADEIGAMANSFNEMQQDIATAASALDEAREGLSAIDNVLHRNAAQQAAVARLGQAALQGSDLDALMRDVLEAVDAVRGVTGSCVVEWDAGGRGGAVRQTRGEVPEPPGARLIAPSPDALLWAQDGRARETGGDGEVRFPASMLMARARAPRAVCAPILGRDGVFGVVTALCSESLAPDELDFLLALANVLGHALDRASAEAEMRRQALYDALTGLPNRVLLTDHLARALARRRRRKDTVALLFCDLDSFKYVNDSHGHTAGDQLLRSVAIRLSEAVRPQDVVARFGGDEFAVLCDGLSSAQDAAVIAQRLIDALAEPFDVAGVEHVVRTSIGIALADADEHDAEDMVREADAAMYRAKDRGEGGYALYDEHMRARALHRLTTDAELRRAIERDELVVHYQPIVGLAAGEIRAFEALVRWNHPRRGLLSPVEFMPVAEQSGAVIGLGAWVLRDACREAAGWDGPTLSVNLSARQVNDRTLVALVAATLQETGLAPERLHLEITESALMDELETSAEVLEGLHRLGVQIVLDDFGTGYSSLAYLRRFPISAVKIDRSFVLDLLGEDPDTTIVRAVIAMCEGLGLDVVAEGVETAAHARVLLDLGCRLAQGYHFARPMPAGDLPLTRRGPLAPAG